MKQLKTIVLLTGIIFFTGNICGFAQNTGKETIVLNGGKQGVVNFGHARHQVIAKDCAICHSVFPQKPGALDESKKTGTVKTKQVMNTICLKCHKDMKKAKEKSGPVSCSKCHVK